MSLSKSFSPTTINAGGVSTLTITLTNPSPQIATLTAPLVDTLPTGVLVAPVPNVLTSCGGVGAPIAVAGASTVTLPAGRAIPANGSCTLTVSVTAAAAGVYVNTLLAGALGHHQWQQPSACRCHVDRGRRDHPSRHPLPRHSIRRRSTPAACRH